MMSKAVELTEAEWQQVMGCMSYAPGRECIPLLNKIGEQLRVQQQSSTHAIDGMERASNSAGMGTLKQ